VIWVHSSGKAARDAATRAARIEAGLAAIEAVAARLASPKTRLKTRVAAEAAATTALQSVGAARWVGFSITETLEVDHRQEKRGRPGANTRYRRTEKTVFTITAAIEAEKVSYDAVTDGCFPLITNDTKMTGAEVLAAYHYQPNLERRNHLLKGPQQVAPVYLETAHRIEALLLCHFLAMLTEALLEREIRTSMKAQGLAGIPLYPELRNCPPERTPDPGDLRRPRPPPAHQRRQRRRPNIPTPTHRPAAAGPGPASHPSQHLQPERRHLKWGAIPPTRSAERESKGEAAPYWPPR
jgi:hypothetical protein